MAVFDLGRLREELERTNREIEQPDFWDKLEYAQKVMKEKKSMEQTIDGYEALEKGLTDIKFATKPYRVTGMTVKAASGKSASGKAIVKWDKKTGTGYQVQIATNSIFTKGKKTYKITNSSTLKKTISGLKAGKKYYVRVRAYKTYGNTAYGDWSNVRSVRM